jgi:ribosomal protein L37AE/L43A
MIYPKYVRMEWEKKKCYIEGRKIVALKLFKEVTDDQGEKYPSEAVERYNPFDFYGQDGQKSLYLRFIEIDEKDPEQIRQFVEHYGFLGIRTYLDGLLEDPVNFPSATQRFAKEMGSDIHLLLSYPETDYETIEDFAREVKRLKALVKLHAAVQWQDREKMLSYINLALSPDYPMPLLLGIAKHKIASDVNAKLQAVSPLLSLREDVTPVSKHSKDSGQKSLFSTTWVARNLLSAMYAMFYMDIQKGIEIRECHNPFCRECFAVNVNDKREAKKIYCSHTCVAAVAQREYRKREKENKEAQP